MDRLPRRRQAGLRLTAAPPPVSLAPDQLLRGPASSSPRTVPAPIIAKGFTPEKGLKVFMIMKPPGEHGRPDGACALADVGVTLVEGRRLAL